MVDRSETVPYANPDSDASAPPVTVMVPLSVAVELVTGSAAWVVTVGVVTGVTELLAADAEPVPTALVAVTVKVYAVPFVKPVTVIGEAEPVPVILPGVEVTV